MLRLENKIAIVTGGASGIGEAVAARFAREGARVVVADVNEAAGIEVARRIQENDTPGSASFVMVDVTQMASVRALVQGTAAKLGGLDILVNNAGIDGEQAPTADCSLENWRNVLAVNLDGVFYGMKFGLEVMAKNASGGSIVNMASVAGLVGYPGIPAYNAAKGGVVQLTRAAAIEYASDRVRVNAVCPTGVLTPLLERFIEGAPEPEHVRSMMASMNPLPGIPTVEDVAAATLFLASEESRFITGVALPVDGGFTAR